MQNSNDAAQIPESFVFHEDPGHGWLEVPYQALVTLQIESKITGYSFRSGQTAYLEEDLDAGTFIKAWLKHKGHAENDYGFFRSHCEDKYAEHTFIRQLRHYYVN